MGHWTVESVVKELALDVRLLRSLAHLAKAEWREVVAIHLNESAISGFGHRANLGAVSHSAQQAQRRSPLA